MADHESLYAQFGRLFPAGTVLFREGEPGREMYVIQSGRVRITRAVTVSRTLAILGPGDFFGEMAILNDKPRAATADVIEDARLLVLGPKTFESMVVSNAEVAVRLVKKLARRLDSANALIEILLQQDPRIRVILGLSRVAEEHGQQREDGVLVPTNTTELAAQIGLDEARVHEVMTRLVRLRVLSEVKGGYLVSDPARIQEFLEFLEMRDRGMDG